MKRGDVSRFSRLAFVGSVLVVLAAAAVATADDKKPTPPPTTPARGADSLAADKFEAALKQYNLFYQRIEVPGQTISFTVGIQDQNNQSTIHHYSIYDCGWKLGDGTEAVTFHGYVQVLAQANLPAAVAQKVAESSDQQTLTWGSTNQNGVFANTGFFFDHGLDPATLWAYVINLHNQAVGLKAVIDPLLTTIKSEK